MVSKIRNFLRSFLYFFSFIGGLLHLAAPLAHGLTTEIGSSYSQKKTTFDTTNYTQSEALTASINFYLLDNVALELSYTAATGLRQEQANDNDPQRLIYQKSEIVGTNLILVLAGRSSPIQPFVKGGVAQIHRRQEIKIDNFDTTILEPENVVVPNYGVGLKFFLTQVTSLKVGYDVWQTPLGDNLKTDDSSLYVGLSWFL